MEMFEPKNPKTREYVSYQLAFCLHSLAEPVTSDLPVWEPKAERELKVFF